MSFKILLAETRGFCAGVERAIAVVNKALEHFGAQKVYVLHEVVHNKHVVAELAAKGVHFVESLEEIPEPQDKVLIFSAHGVGLETKKRAQELQLYVIDAICPLVDRIHHKVAKAAAEHKEVVIIGHKGHQEVLGTIGQYTGPDSNVHVILHERDVDQLQLNTEHAVFATQTTLSIDETARTVAALKAKYPFIEGPKHDDTCFATQNRQAAVKLLAHESDLVLVAGSANSSNSRRLSEVASNEGTPAYLIDDYTGITDEMLEGAKNIGITAGASVPEQIVTGIVEYLQGKGVSSIESVGPASKRRSFPLPESIMHLTSSAPENNDKAE